MRGKMIVLPVITLIVLFLRLAGRLRVHLAAHLAGDATVVMLPALLLADAVSHAHVAIEKKKSVEQIVMMRGGRLQMSANPHAVLAPR
jgi:hypothetical protein